MPGSTIAMRDKSRVRAMIVALALVFVVLFGSSAPARAETDGMIRVKLTRLGAPTTVEMVADCDYYLMDDPTVRVPAGEHMTVAADGPALTLSFGGETRALGQTLRLMRSEAGNCGLRFIQPERSNRFCGDIGFAASGGVITAILNIYIENYLYGVVGYEMPPSSGIEALKAQAVAARTYAMRKKVTRTASAYDVTDSTADQVFKGMSAAPEYANAIQAVNETRGGVLYYGNSLAQCYYGASNGGQVESTRNAWGTSLPYSVVKDDPYDLESTAATAKTATVSKDLSNLNPALRNALAQGVRSQLAAHGLDADAADARVEAIESVTACDSRYAAPSRLYKSLTFKLRISGKTADGARRSGTVAVSIPTYGAFESWYDLSINGADNETVWVTETDRAFKITFRRFGHGIGLSQRGAQVMAGRYGKRMAEILEFYYPGTNGRVLDLADATRDVRAESTAAPAISVGEPIATARLMDSVSLMNAPSDEADATAVVAGGAAVDVYGVKDEWAAVGSGGKYGFVRAGNLTSFALINAEITRAEGEAYAEMNDAADVLQWPVDGAKVLGAAEGGARVRVHAWTEDWAMIECPDGATGFVPVTEVRMVQTEAPEEAVEEDEAGAADEVVTAPDDLYGQLRQDTQLFSQNDAFSEPIATLYQGTVVKLVAYDAAWAYVLLRDGRSGYIDVTAVAALDMAQMRGEAADAAVDDGVTVVSGVEYRAVLTDGALVYETPSSEATVLATLAAGERVRVGAYNDQWACVRRDGATGYMLMQDLSEEVDAPEPEENDGGEVTYEECAARANRTLTLYASADESGAALGEVPEGAEVRVYAWNRLYAYAAYGDWVGFVRLDGLDRLE